MSEIEDELKAGTALVDAELERLLPGADVPEHRLFEAMRYAALSGGKRLRPFIVLASAAIFGVAERQSRRVAAAVRTGYMWVNTYAAIFGDVPFGGYDVRAVGDRSRSTPSILASGVDLHFREPKSTDTTQRVIPSIPSWSLF